MFNIMLVAKCQQALSRFYYLTFMRNCLWKTQKSLDKFIMLGSSIRRRVSIFACAIATAALGVEFSLFGQSAGATDGTLRELRRVGNNPVLSRADVD
jgi:NADH:ubiquinone oxidoreductase subunit 2 (subunit N)